MSSSQQESR
jgi:structural maintenance of chromosome 4